VGDLGAGDGASPGGPEGAQRGQRAQRAQQAQWARWGAWLGFVAAFAAIAVVTLTPAPGSALADARFFCLLCGSAPLANLLRNVVLFLPLGFFAFHLLPRLWAVTLAAFVLSGSVETLQFFIPGRNPLLVDLLANTAGGALGGLVAARLPAWLRLATGGHGADGRAGSEAGNEAGERDGPRRLFGAALAVATLLAATPAWLLVPAPPVESLWVQWNPRLGPAGRYDGAILDARVGDELLPAGPVARAVDVADRFLAGQPVVLTFPAAPPAEGTRGLFRILSADDGREVLTVTIEGTTVRTGVPYRAARLGLARPRVTATRLLDHAVPGATVVLSLTLGRDGDLRLDAGDAGWHAPGADPSMGWSLLYYPEGTGPWAAGALGFLWCGMLLFGPAFLAPSRGAAAVSGVALLALLVALGAVTPLLAPLTVAGWAGAIAGWVSGRVGRGMVARRRRVVGER
jgi:hypothetical protein